MIGYVLLGAVVLMMMLVVVLMQMAGRSEIDYFDLSAMGIVWIVFGAVMLALGDEDMLFFLIIGIASAAAGLSRKEQWNYRPWKSIPKQERRMKLLQLIILTMIVLAMFVAWMMR
jgi:hypothetical protein